MTLPEVSVVTLTRDRPDALLRAVRSVAAQTGVAVEQIVVGDDADHLRDPDHLAQLRAVLPGIVIENVARPAAPEYRSARLGRLRNRGIALATGEFVGQLDDDNTFAPDHLSSLVRALTDNPHVEVAHSWRLLVDPAGQPYVPDGEDPWHPDPDPERRALSYRYLCEHGVFTPGSNVVRDRFASGGTVLARIDTSEYLVRRRFHAGTGFPETFSPARQKLEWTEDFVFALQLARAGVEVVCTERATVNYTMGGFSNSHALQSDAG
ncbi:glycosyltransferase family 2 protein [Kitasatospora sp. NPDC101447]|uniref:glycosyltransferase family 2 protein n=1 Tax=Kitasatospora sp. NPDC101447 TaxID=3364102 RepID=UPI00382D45C3